MMNIRRLELTLFLLESCTALAAGFAGWVLLSGIRLPSTPLAVLPSGAVVAVLTLMLAVFFLHRRIGERKSSEHQLRNLLDASPDAIVVADKLGRIMRLNSQAEKLFGYASGELIGKALERLLRLNRGDAKEARLVSDTTQTTAKISADRPCYVGWHKSGTPIAIEVSFSSIETHEGTLVLHSIRDVTEFNRKQRRRAARHAVRQILLEAETLEIAAPQVLHAMGEILGWDGAIWWDVNPRTHELRRLASWCVPEFESTSFEMNLSMCSQAAASLPRGNGGIVWGSFSNEGSVQVRFGSESEPGESLTLPLAVGNEVLGRIELYREKCELPDENIGETMGVIGAQISQFLQRKRAEETLRRSEARKAAILEAALDGIVSVTRDGRVIELNSAADRMFGYPVGGAVGLRLADLILPPITTTPQSSGWTHVLSTGEKGMLGRRLELNGRRADGSTFPVEVAIAPIRAEGAAMFTAYIRDLTERKKTEEALRRAEEQFRQAQKMEAIGRLAGGVAHDFNNVLTVIIGFGEQLLMTMSKDHPERPAIEEIVKSGTRGADLTRQLLAFSRRQVLQPRLLDINGIVTDMEKMLNRLLGRQFPLTANLASDLPPVKADPCQIEQVLMNLVVNGRDAMPKGGTVFIETAAREVVDPCGHAHAEVAPGKYVTLSVRDTGCGMDEATKARIFEPFFTTKEKGKGTGLGLATVYGIVKQSGGGIVVESQPGQGSTFTIYLPQESKSSSDTRSAMPTINKAKDLRRLNEGTSSVKNRATPLTAG